MGKSVKPYVKKAVWKRDKYRCRYCNITVVYDPAVDPSTVPNGATVDHIIPRSKGGGSHQKNLVTSCFPCNSKKADTPIAV